MIRRIFSGLTLSLMIGWAGVVLAADESMTTGYVQWDAGTKSGRWSWGNEAPLRVKEAALTWGVRKYEAPDSRINVILFPELGMSLEVFDDGGKGLAPTLQSEGIRAWVLQRGDAVSGENSSHEVKVKEEEALAQFVVSSLSAEKSGERWFLLGHGVGGGIVYRLLAANSRLNGVIALNVPFSSGGSTRAFRTFVEKVTAHQGRRVPWTTFLGTSMGKSTLGELLLGKGDFAPEYAQPMDAERLRSYLGDGLDSPTPFKNHWVKDLAAQPDIRALIFLGAHDGWSPPWQCDPTLFGLVRGNITREHLTRANGQATEYNHLDLLLGPNAKADVFEPIVEWLGVTEP